MSGLTYPREWFRVSHWGGAIEARTMVRETAAKLAFQLGKGERLVSKATTYEAWYPTREEAEAALAEINARKAAKVARDRLNAAAPELAEALRGFVRNRAQIRADYPFDGPLCRLMDMAEAALAKAGL